jgi:hypothetical protein
MAVMLAEWGGKSEAVDEERLIKLVSGPDTGKIRPAWDRTRKKL